MPSENALCAWLAFKSKVYDYDTDQSNYDETGIKHETDEATDSPDFDFLINIPLNMVPKTFDETTDSPDFDFLCHEFWNIRFVSQKLCHCFASSVIVMMSVAHIKDSIDTNYCADCPNYPA